MHQIIMEKIQELPLDTLLSIEENALDVTTVNPAKLEHAIRVLKTFLYRWITEKPQKGRGRPRICPNKL